MQSASPSTRLFNATVLDMRGRIAMRQLQAESIEHARELATESGHTIIECAPVSTGGLSSFSWRLAFKRHASIDHVAFSQDLSTLMDAGVTIKDAVAALSAKETSESRRQVLTHLMQLMAEGKSFSSALERAGAFPGLLVATVSASEQTGDLATGLARYATHQQSLRNVRDKLVGACVYPLLLLTVGSLVVLMLLGVVVPRFSRLIDNTGRDLPALSKLLMAWGQLVDTHPSVFLGLVAGLFALGLLVAYRWRDADLRKQFLARLPGVAPLVREFQHLQLYRTTAILTARGLTFHKALHFGQGLLSPVDRERLAAGLQLIREGTAISTALSSCGFSDVVATNMLAVAEKSGTLPELLDRIADFYERSLQRNMDVLTRLIEPVLMIIFGIVVGGIVVLMYLPIFDLASSFS